MNPKNLSKVIIVNFMITKLILPPQNANIDKSMQVRNSNNNYNRNQGAVKVKVIFLLMLIKNTKMKKLIITTFLNYKLMILVCRMEPNKIILVL